jgi:hypothetical protein
MELPSIGARTVRNVALTLTFLAFAASFCGEPDGNWSSYHVTMWVGGSPYRDPKRIPLFFQRLRELGADAVTWHPGENLEIITTNEFQFYGENIVNRGLCLKFSSKVTDWEKFLADWSQNERPETALVRDYCLEDPKWRSYARKEIQEVAREGRQHKPFAYDIRDELSVTISANPFDYDFSPCSLEKFREWLRSQYADLDALNRAWETDFAAWDQVKPFTTDQIKNRMSTGDRAPRGKPDWQALRALKFDSETASQSPTRWNLSPWVDFRTFMDISMASALSDIRAAAKAEDPATPVGVEGTQMPSAWGGYDLWRLSRALDWLEPYDICNAREILGSFMPGAPFMTTVFEKEADPASRRLWHLLLEGDRGCILWWSEDMIDWTSQDYSLTAKAKALGPVLHEMKSPLAELFRKAQRQYDPIAIHYSQASIQVDWLLESVVDGPSWIRRFSSFEAEHNRLGKVRNSWLKALQDLGYSPRFISSEQIEAGELESGRYKALILPSSFALSDKERAKILAFRTGDGIILADTTPGFDSHGKARVVPELRVPQKTVVAFGKRSDSIPEDIAAYMKERLGSSPATEFTSWLGKVLQDVPASIKVPASARLRVHRYQSGRAELVALEPNINYQMSEELKQAGGNETLEKPMTCTVGLSQPLFVRDLRLGKNLGRVNQFTLTIDPWEPSLLSIAEQETDLPQ